MADYFYGQFSDVEWHIDNIGFEGIWAELSNGTFHFLEDSGVAIIWSDERNELLFEGRIEKVKILRKLFLSYSINLMEMISELDPDIEFPKYKLILSFET